MGEALGRGPGQLDTEDHYLGHVLGLLDLVGGRGRTQEPWQFIPLLGSPLGAEGGC